MDVPGGGRGGGCSGVGEDLGLARIVQTSAD